MRTAPVGGVASFRPVPAPARNPVRPADPSAPSVTIPGCRRTRSRQRSTQAARTRCPVAPSEERRNLAGRPRSCVMSGGRFGYGRMAMPLGVLVDVRGHVASTARAGMPANASYDEQVLKSGVGAGSAAAPVKPYGNLAAIPLVVPSAELLDATSKRARRRAWRRARGRAGVVGAPARSVGDSELATPLSAMIVSPTGASRTVHAARRGA
jgi:hypothetical protein